MKIDVYTHVMPPKYKRLLYKYGNKFEAERTFLDRCTALSDMSERMKVLEDYRDISQVLSVTLPPLEDIVKGDEAVELAQRSNDEMAEWVVKYPEKFIGAIANLPLDDIDTAVREAERSVKELGFRGVQVYTSIQGRPLSDSRFLPLFETMADLDLPVWIHPVKSSNAPDYPVEEKSLHQVFSVFGWPYETTKAMTRLVFAGIFEKFPKIKIITHHCGGMVPYFAGRIFSLYNNALERLGTRTFEGLTKHPLEYFKMFYADTVLNGHTQALLCGYDFFGEDHILFGSDMPYGLGGGSVSIAQTLHAVEGMGVSESSKKKIYLDNARRLLRLQGT